MALDAKLILDAFNKLFDEFDERMDRRFAALFPAAASTAPPSVSSHAASVVPATAPAPAVTTSVAPAPSTPPTSTTAASSPSASAASTTSSSPIDPVARGAKEAVDLNSPSRCSTVCRSADACELVPVSTAAATMVTSSDTVSTELASPNISTRGEFIDGGLGASRPRRAHPRQPCPRRQRRAPLRRPRLWRPRRVPPRRPRSLRPRRGRLRVPRLRRPRRAPPRPPRPRRPRWRMSRPRRRPPRAMAQHIASEDGTTSAMLTRCSAIVPTVQYSTAPAALCAEEANSLKRPIRCSVICLSHDIDDLLSVPTATPAPSSTFAQHSLKHRYLTDFLPVYLLDVVQPMVPSSVSVLNVFEGRFDQKPVLIEILLDIVPLPTQVLSQITDGRVQLRPAPWPSFWQYFASVHWLHLRSLVLVDSATEAQDLGCCQMNRPYNIELFQLQPLFSANIFVPSSDIVLLHLATEVHVDSGVWGVITSQCLVMSELLSALGISIVPWPIQWSVSDNIVFAQGNSIAYTQQQLSDISWVQSQFSRLATVVDISPKLPWSPPIQQQMQYVGFLLRPIPWPSWCYHTVALQLAEFLMLNGLSIIMPICSNLFTAWHIKCCWAYTQVKSFTATISICKSEVAAVVRTTILLLSLLEDLVTEQLSGPSIMQGHSSSVKCYSHSRPPGPSFWGQPVDVSFNSSVTICRTTFLPFNVSGRYLVECFVAVVQAAGVQWRDISKLLPSSAQRKVQIFAIAVPGHHCGLFTGGIIVTGPIKCDTMLFSIYSDLLLSYALVRHHPVGSWCCMIGVRVFISAAFWYATFTSVHLILWDPGGGPCSLDAYTSLGLGFTLKINQVLTKLINYWRFLLCMLQFYHQVVDDP